MIECGVKNQVKEAKVELLWRSLLVPCACTHLFSMPALETRAVFVTVSSRHILFTPSSSSKRSSNDELDISTVRPVPFDPSASHGRPQCRSGCCKCLRLYEKKPGHPALLLEAEARVGPHTVRIQRLQSLFEDFFFCLRGKVC